MVSSESLSSRVIELESLVTHLQRDLQQLSDVILGQQTAVESLKRAVQRLENHLDRLPQQPEDRDPLQERPPHY